MGLKTRKLWEQLHSGLQWGALCLAYPPCPCAFLEATGEGGSSNSLAWESAGPNIAQCNQHPICQLEEKGKKRKRTVQRRPDIARKEMQLFLHIRLLMIDTGRAQKPSFQLPEESE